GPPRELVARAHKEEHRTADVGERYRAPVDDEAARHHPVVHDELVDELAERWAGPRNEAFAAEEAAPRLAPLERLPIAELLHEAGELRDLLPEAEELEPRARDPAGQALDAIQRGFDERSRRPNDARGHVGAHFRKVLVDVDRAAEGDDRGHALGAPVSGRLVG